MRHILVATEEERLRVRLTAPLAEAGFAVRSASTWRALLRGALDPGCGLILVDARLQGLQPDLLAAICEGLPRAPELRSVGAAPPLRTAPGRADLMLRLARRCGSAALEPQERREIRLMGLAGGEADALPALARAAAAPVPLYLEGERGTGKQRVARFVHRLSSLPGDLQALAPDARWTPSGPAGGLYLKDLDRWEPQAINEIERAARGAGWRLMGGARRPSAHLVPDWSPMRLAPLRERREDLRALTLLYVDRHRRRLGLPRRRLDRAMWERVHAHRWPENARELERFVIQLLASCSGTVIRGESLPPHILRLLADAPDAALQEQARSFEETVSQRLRPIVSQYDPGAGTGLHRLVIEATERALIQLALGRTGGNQKAAAEFLGLARNTLRAKAKQLGLVMPRRRR